MEYRILGKTGLKISRLGFGGIPIQRIDAEGTKPLMQQMKEAGRDVSRIQHSDFIQRMDLAYAVADVVISRSGASSVSELCAAHKATIFVPSPNVTEDHQTHNAMALVNKDAALIVKDVEADEKLMKTACELIEDTAKVTLLEENIGKLALRDAAMTIVDEIYRIVR